MNERARGTGIARIGALVATLVLVAGAAIVVGAPGADARWGGVTRSEPNPFFNDLAICTDGVQYQFGLYNDDGSELGSPFVGTEPLQLRLDDGTVVLDETKTITSIWTDPLPSGFPPYIVPGGLAFETFDDPWIGGPLPAGSHVNVYMYHEGIPDWVVAEDMPGDPRVVTACEEPDSVSIDIGGRRPYLNSGELSAGDFMVNQGAVSGQGTILGATGGDAAVSIDVHKLWFLRLGIGRVEVADPGAGTSRSGIFVGRLTGADGSATGKGYLAGRGIVPISFTVVDNG